MTSSGNWLRITAAALWNERTSIAVGSCWLSTNQPHPVSNRFQFVYDFYQGALGRAPYSTEQTQWETTLTQAQAQGAGSLIVAAQSLGSTLFTSTEYSNRSRTNSQLVTDLYAGQSLAGMILKRSLKSKELTPPSSLSLMLAIRPTRTVRPL